MKMRILRAGERTSQRTNVGVERTTMHQSRKSGRANATKWRQRTESEGDRPAEFCTVVPKTERPWWQIWARRWKAEHHEVEVELVKQVEQVTSGAPLLRTDVQMNRWRAKQIGLQHGSVIVLDRDTRVDPDKVATGLRLRFGRVTRGDTRVDPDNVGTGLCLRFGRVTRIRRTSTKAVVQVDWCQYSDDSVLRETIARRPNATAAAPGR